MLAQYTLILSFLLATVESSAHATQIMQEDMQPQKPKLRQSDLNSEQRKELENRLFWAFEKNSHLSADAIHKMTLTIYAQMNVVYDEKPAQHYVPYGCMN